jgi:ubiquinone/menaquinone biosynthesis C-methylase UbiE
MTTAQNTATLTDYDTNASHYDQFRRPSPIIRGILKNMFSGAEDPILSLGCGTGRMEVELTASLEIFGLDRSTGMLTPAKSRVENLSQGDMTQMPFAANSFAGAYFMQSLHHVGANLSLSSDERTAVRRQALSEAIRVIQNGPIGIIQRDPSQNQAVWFWQYFPSALDTKMVIQPKVAQVAEWLTALGLTKVTVTPINDPMAKNFYDPESLLNPSYRRSFSDFSYLSEAAVAHGLANLRADIETGAVMEKIEACRQCFAEIGGTVHIISAEK